MELELDNFEQTLRDGLYKLCDSAGLTDGEMTSPDIQAKWDEYIKDYVGDAVENFNEYPMAALGFAAFLGMAVAHHWDKNWIAYKKKPYKYYYGDRGFDNMDDHITDDILNLKDLKYAEEIKSCVQATLGLIQHEGIEAQTAFGFHALVRACGILYTIGASMELKRLGYKKQLIQPKS